MIKIKELSKKDYYYTICFTKEEMIKFLRKAKKNWKTAVEKSNTSEYMKDYISNIKSRGKLAEFMEKELKLGKKTKILDIGAGMGALTLALAKRFDTSATDINILSLRFIKYRAEQEKIKLKLYKIAPIHKGLPFKENSFDALVMNGVLEWVAEGFTDLSDVTQTQIKSLKEAYRVIKPNGRFILAIENRFAMDWFKGKTSHVPVKYLDLLPRKIANFICKLKTGKEFRTYIYSKRGYRKMFQNAGFKDIKFYEAYPSYQKPEVIKRKISNFANSFIIVARKLI